MSFFLDIIEIHVGLGKLYAKLTEEEKKKSWIGPTELEYCGGCAPPSSKMCILSSLNPKFKEIEAENDPSRYGFAKKQGK